MRFVFVILSLHFETSLLPRDTCKPVSVEKRNPGLCFGARHVRSVHKALQMAVESAASDWYAPRYVPLLVLW